VIAWPVGAAGEAIEALARSCSADAPARGIPEPPVDAGADPRRFGEWIEAAASSLGLEAQPIVIRYGRVSELVRSAAPALILCSKGVVALSGSGAVIAADGATRRVGSEAIRATLCGEAERPVAAEIDSLLDSAGVPRRRRARARRELLDRRLATAVVGHCWLLRLDSSAPFSQQMAAAGIWKRLLLLAASHTVQYLLWLLGWWIVGVGALSGRVERGLLIAWCLLLATLVPLRAAVTWLQGRIAITASGLLKERLLAGALRLDPDEVKAEGAGQLLGRVIESEALETLALSGGFLALVSVVELVASAVVLAAGAAAFWSAGLLVLWVGVTMWLGGRYYRDESRWAEQRLGMTDDLVETMVGHRTRLAQEPREQMHVAEDRALERYQEVSRRLDKSAARLAAVAPRGWLALGIAGLAPAFLAGAPSSQLAVGIGGVALAYGAFRRLAGGLWSLSGARIAWKQVAPVFRAAARRESAGMAALATATASGARDTILEAHAITFRYHDRGEPVLQRCNLTVSRGDRILIEGASGSGKSTLASLLAGVNSPESGLLLAEGMDHRALGPSGWRRRVAAAPQFHENHVLTGPFAFNLLMGRGGWMSESDMKEAESVCRELGLGPLLEKMPGGMLQMVGETGWQLSHGERSRLYIARALLQQAGVVILDESFAALDPENLRLAVDCVLRRAGTLVVIAHP
jgi:ATP-binding cassette subfamily B protein